MNITVSTRISCLNLPHCLIARTDVATFSTGVTSQEMLFNLVHCKRLRQIEFSRTFVDQLLTILFVRYRHNLSCSTFEEITSMNKRLILWLTPNFRGTNISMIWISCLKTSTFDDIDHIQIIPCYFFSAKGSLEATMMDTEQLLGELSVMCREKQPKITNFASVVQTLQKDVDLETDELAR